MRIFCISHQCGIIGAERSLLETVTWLKSRGHEILVALPFEGPLGEALAESGIETRVFPYKPWLAQWTSRKERIKTAWTNGKIAKDIARAARGFKADLIYSNTMVVAVGALAAKRARIPHVWHIREFGKEDHGLLYHWGKERSLGWANRTTKLFLCNSKAVAEEYRPFFGPHRVQVVHQGVQIPDSTPPPELPAKCRFRCVMATMLHPGKGHEEAIRAVALLDAQLLIAGAAPFPDYEKKLKRLVEELDVEHRVFFLGRLEKVWPVIQTADAVLVCSRKEAYGRVTVEAMFQGIPVVGSRSGGTPELLGADERGLLYKPGEEKDLAEKIQRLIDEPSLCESLGVAGKAWAEEHCSLDVYGEAVERHLESVIR